MNAGRLGVPSFFTSLRCVADRAHLRQGDAGLQPAPAELRAALCLHRPVHLHGGGPVDGPRRAHHDLRLHAGLPGLPHGVRRPADHHGRPVVSIPRGPDHRHRHAQHVDQRRDLQADARRAHDDADRQLSDRDGQADEQAAANRAAAGDLAAAAGGGARVRRRSLGLSAVRLVRDADGGCLRRVPEPVLLDLHPPGLRGDSPSHPGDRFSVRVHSADPGPSDLPQGPFGPHDQSCFATSIRT